MDSYTEKYQIQDRNDGRIAVAEIMGGPLAPDLHGMATFRDLEAGTEVCV